MKKTLAILFFAFLLNSCGKSSVNIDLNTFNGDLAKAFYSKFKLTNDEVYLLDSQSPFTGTIEFKADSTIGKKMYIKDGIIYEVTSFKSDGEVYDKITIKDKEGTLENIPDSNKVEIKCKFFNLGNLGIISSNLNDHECDCTVNDKKENKSLKIVTRIDKKTGIIVSNHKGTSLTSNETKAKVRIYTKKLPSGLILRVRLSEDFEPEHSFSSIYEEDMSVEKDGESVRLRISYKTDEDIYLYTDIADYENKHCRESDKLTNHDTYLFPNFQPDNSTCVNDGIELINSAFNKKFTREELKNRILDKIKNNMYLGKDSEDVKFFFE